VKARLAALARYARVRSTAETGTRYIVASTAGFVAIGGWCVGVVPPAVGGLAVALATVQLWARGRAVPFLQHVLLVFVAGFATLAVVDLALRPVINERVFRRIDPERPQLRRYNANVVSVTEQYGDLARMHGGREHREPRRVRFEIDAHGFRNESAAGTGHVDLIVLGDSFGVGVGTTQERTWPTLLAERLGRTTYNLSMPGNPWHEYATLAVEGPRLRTHPGTIVLWALFSGNDLAGGYGPVDLAKLTRNDLVWQLKTSLATFQRRSPIRQMLAGFADRRRTRLGIVAHCFVNGRTMLFYAPYVVAANRTSEAIRAHPGFLDLKAVVAAMRRFIDAMGVSVRIVVIPSKEEVYRWVVDGAAPWSTPATPTPFATVVGELAREHDIDVLDLMPVLVGAARRAFDESGAALWWYDDTHWNERGHEAAAAEIGAWLAAARTRE